MVAVDVVVRNDIVIHIGTGVSVNIAIGVEVMIDLGVAERDSAGRVQAQVQQGQ